LIGKLCEIFFDAPSSLDFRSCVLMQCRLLWCIADGREFLPLGGCVAYIFEVAPKQLLLPISLVAAALAGAAALLFFTGTPEQSASRPENDVPARPSQSAASGGGFGSEESFTPSASEFAQPQPVEQANTSEIADSSSGVVDEVPMQPWEMAINKILESDEENQQVAAKLMALVPTLPPDGQIEAAQHMVNLTDDQSYQNAAAILLNPATSQEVTEVIYSDVLNRPNTVKLPLMVSILRTPGHRMRDGAIGTLQVSLGEDLGDNPEAWNAAVQNYLAKEAQEAAAAELEAQAAQ
jgi:hypothetical protein